MVILWYYNGIIIEVRTWKERWEKRREDGGLQPCRLD